MPEPRPAQSPSDAEAELWNAIAYFEKILEALPNDRLSIETLASAYEKVGDHTRAKTYTLRLAEVLIEEGDADGAEDLLAKIRQYDPDDPAVADVALRLETLQPKKVMALVMDDKDVVSRRATNIAGEISLAWTLLQGNKLSQEDYAHVVHDLSENSTRSLDVPVSTLHVLHDRNHAGFNEILAFVSAAGSAPIISLACFDIPPDTAGLLPIEFSVKRGAIVFERMGNDALVAVLNPCDAQLIQDLEEIVGKGCHRFLAAPADFDAALERIRKDRSAGG